MTDLILPTQHHKTISQIPTITLLPSRSKLSITRYRLFPNSPEESKLVILRINLQQKVHNIDVRF